MDNLFSNSNIRKDFLRWKLESLGKDRDVFIAVAFFTYSDLIEKFLNNNCTIYLIVRLGFPTNPIQLERILSKKNILIRFYTDRSFHPKLYIFENEAAFVGSSNLTDSGLLTNQELNVQINYDNPAFEELNKIFSEYWEYANPLTKEDLSKYKLIWNNLVDINLKAEQNIEKRIGNICYPNIRRPDKDKKDKKQIFHEKLLKRYQNFLNKFDNLREIYLKIGQRKISEEKLPLRIEIDQFLNWIRKTKAQGNTYENAPTRKNPDLTNFIIDNIQDFLKTEFSDIIEVSQKRYPLISKNLSSSSKIDSLTEKELLTTISNIHAFAARFRYYGSIEQMLETFLEDNGLEKIKLTLKNLLFGQGDFRNRIVECIFNPKYELRHFGTSCIEETFGWANSQDIPICNERTYRSMQWLGFGKM